MPKYAIGREPGLARQVADLLGEAWESVSLRLGGGAVLLLAQRGNEPIAFLAIDTEVKEDAFTYIKKLAFREDLDHEELVSVLDHILSQALKEAGEMGAAQLCIEEERPFVLDLVRRYGFHEWRRDLVMETDPRTIRDTEADPSISVERVPRDVESFVDAWNSIVASDPDSFVDFPPITKEYIEAKLTQPGSQLDPDAWFIASLHERICGLITIDTNAEIGDLMVSVLARRKGVGTALVKHALAYLQTKGVRRATVVLREENAPAQALYSKTGFRTTTTRISLAARTI